MPTISIYHQDFEHLLGRAATIEEIEAQLPLVKGELKDHNPTSGEIRIELQDSNRPDLWSVEGITRQIRSSLEGHPVQYPFFRSKSRPKRCITVAAGMEKVRPFVAACTALNYKVTEEGLAQLIQAQEKLADLYGHKRRSVSIGLYRLNLIQFPVTYGLIKPQEARFVPLGFSEKLTLQDILAIHPKGMEFGSILAGHDSLPLLWDKEGQVLSFPPIINSQEIGEVHPGDTELLIEVTGSDFRMVLLTLNIFAANLTDRGASIEPVEVAYPYATEFGKTVRTPCDFTKVQQVSVHTIESALGLPLGAEAIKKALINYGYEVKAGQRKLALRLPCYRNDFMHAVDIAEDVAISRGYESFTPLMPAQFTVGALSSLETTSDHIRDHMVGLGYQEIISNILMSSEDLVDRMRLTDQDPGKFVEVDNVMSQNFSCLRPWVIPSLLRVETASPRTFYPHRLFELGEVVVPDLGQELGSRTFTKLGAIIAHPTSSFSEAHTSLDQLMYHLVRAYTLEPTNHLSFLDGRVGTIICEGQTIGIIGELHPEVLEAWQINMPVALFELEIEPLIEKGWGKPSSRTAR